MLAFRTHEKKVLALVLAFAMAFTMMATAGAAYTDQADIQATEAVEMLNAIGVMTGDPDGSFRPNDTITRAEACRMIYTIRTNSDDASAYADMQTTFKDVPADAWYAGYVKHCQAAGIVSGTAADGSTFEPNRDVTGVELALMCLRVMGYDPAKADIGGSTWSTKTIGYATEAGLLDGVNTTITSACPRQWAAQIMYNTIDARTVRWSNDSETYTDLNMGGGKMDKVGKKYMKLYSDIGTLTSISGDSLTINVSASDAPDSDNTDIGDHSFTKLGQDYSALLGQKVKVLYREGKTNDVVGVYALEDNTSYSVAIKDIEKDGDKVKFDGKSYGFDDGSKIAVVTLDATNETVDTTKTMSAAEFDTDANKVATQMVNFVDNDGDGKFNIAIITDYLTKEVTYVGSDRITAGTTYKMEDENIADDIAKDDWAMISYNMYDECLDIVKAEVVTDTLNSSKDKTSYKQYEIGSTWYNIKNDEAANVSVGDTVKAYIVAGVVVKIDTDDGTGAIPSNIAVVVGKGSGTLEGDRVKLRFFDGTLKTVTLDDKGDVKNADSANLGEAYKVSGTDSNTRLDSLKAGNKYNGYYYNTKTDGTTVLSGSVAAKTIKGEKVDDNAVVILYTTNGSSKKITGKQFNALDAKDLMGYGAAFTKDVNGLSRVMLAAVQVNSTSISGTSYDNYGYIVTDGSEKANGDIAFTMWNGTENVEVLWENGDAEKLVQGTLVAYASIDENKYVQDGVVIGTLEEIQKGTAPVSDEGFTAAANKANDSKTISVNDTSLDVTADTHVLVLDTDADKDLDIGQPYTYGDKLATAAKTGDTYHNNVVYRIEDAGAPEDGADLDLVVVDVTGAFDFDKPGSTSDDNNNNNNNSSSLDNVTASGVRTNDDGDLIFNLTVTKPEWAADTATYDVTYELKGDGKVLGTYTESGLNAGSTKVTKTTADFNVYSNISLELKSMTATEVKVRFFNGDTELTVGTGKQVTTTNAAVDTTTGEQLDVTANWLAGQVSAKADYTISGATGTTLKGSVSNLTNASGVAQSANIGDNDTKALGTGYVDVKFSNVTSSGTMYAITAPDDLTLADYGITNADKDKKVIVAADPDSAISAGTFVTLKVKLGDSGSFVAGSTYKVDLTIGSKTYSKVVATANSDTELTTQYQVTGNLDITKDMIEVTEVQSLRPTKVEILDGGKQVLVTMNKALDKTVSTSTAANIVTFADKNTGGTTVSTVAYVDATNNQILITMSAALEDGDTFTFAGASNGLKDTDGGYVVTKANDLITIALADSTYTYEIGASA